MALISTGTFAFIQGKSHPITLSHRPLDEQGSMSLSYATYSGEYPVDWVEIFALVPDARCKPRLSTTNMND